jgi:hypothetical protein
MHIQQQSLGRGSKRCLAAEVQAEVDTRGVAQWGRPGGVVGVLQEAAPGG